MRLCALLAAVPAFLLLLVACGGGSTETKVVFTMERDCKVARADPASAKAGKITFEVVNRTTLPLKFTVDGFGRLPEAQVDVQPGQTKNTSANLKAGDYKLSYLISDFCEISFRVG